jgi:hypothetical protein
MAISSGKTYAASLIIKSIFAEGTESKHYKFFSTTKDFPRNDKLEEYKVKVRLARDDNSIGTFLSFLVRKETMSKAIKAKVKKCAYSVFVFDEMDKMPPGLIDSLRVYLEHHEKVDGVDYRRSTFIFLR